MEEKVVKKEIEKEKKLSFSEKLLAVQMEIEAAPKDSSNPFFKSKYADLNAIYAVAKPVLNKYRLFLLHTDGWNQRAEMCVKTVIKDVDSDREIDIEVPIICKEENNPQALGSAITYARRYGLSALLAIETEDDDGNSAAAVSEKPKTINTVEEAKAILGDNSGKKCPRCGKELIIRKGTHGDFWGCTGYPTCSYAQKI